MGYISPQGAANLAHHKYSGTDHSILVKLFMGKFWNWLIEFVPRNIAPNLLTTLGLSCIALTFYINYVHCPSLDCVSPSWVYIVSALLIWAYQILDNLDGKQARRTGTSSPLGEIFDHGGDSLTVPVFAMVTGLALQVGPIVTFTMQMLLLVVFFMSHWEAYFIGTFIMRPIDNPTEAQCTLMTLLIISGLAGPEFWLADIWIPLFGAVQLNQIVFFVVVIGAVNTCIDNFTKVSEHFSNLQMDMKPAIQCLSPIAILLGMSSLSVWLSPITFTEHPIMYMFAVGFQFSYITIRLIVQNVCKEHFKTFYNVQLASVFFTFTCVLASMNSPLMDIGFSLQIYFYVSFGVIAYLIYTVVRELASILNISVFTITPLL